MSIQEKTPNISHLPETLYTNSTPFENMMQNPIVYLSVIASRWPNVEMVNLKYDAEEIHELNVAVALPYN